MLGINYVVGGSALEQMVFFFFVFFLFFFLFFFCFFLFFFLFFFFFFFFFFFPLACFSCWFREWSLRSYAMLAFPMITGRSIQDILGHRELITRDMMMAPVETEIKETNSHTGKLVLPLEASKVVLV
jgi:hypothetical protein